MMMNNNPRKVPLKKISAHSFRLVVFIILSSMLSIVPSPLTAQQDGAPELSAEASRAIDKGLTHLLSIQNDDGSWDSAGDGRC